MRLASKVVLITGGISGIGKATALAFARLGATVVVSGRREAVGAALAAELKAMGNARDGVCQRAALLPCLSRHEGDADRCLAPGGERKRHQGHVRETEGLAGKKHTIDRYRGTRAIRNGEKAG